MLRAQKNRTVQIDGDQVKFQVVRVCGTDLVDWPCHCGSHYEFVQRLVFFVPDKTNIRLCAVVGHGWAGTIPDHH